MSAPCTHLQDPNDKLGWEALAGRGRRTALVLPRGPHHHIHHARRVVVCLYGVEVREAGLSEQRHPPRTLLARAITVRPAHAPPGEAPPQLTNQPANKPNNHVLVCSPCS